MKGPQVAKSYFVIVLNFISADTGSFYSSHRMASYLQDTLLWDNVLPLGRQHGEFRLVKGA
jgi:hypothetical protein